MKKEEESGISTKERPKKKIRETTVSRCHKFLSDKISKVVCERGHVKVAVFTHPSPDPDAVGGLMGFAWMLKKSYENLEVDCFYDGIISHPQNQRMVNLLDPDLKLYTECDPSSYDIKVSIDVIPSHAACPPNISFDLVIDHHKEAPSNSFKGLYLNLKAGSACSTVYQLIKQHGLSFEEDNDNDSKVATALLVGIIIDTDYQTSDDTSEIDHKAYGELFNFRNPVALKQITKFKHPRDWVQARANVAQKAHDRIKDGVLIHGIGFITSSNRDLIAIVADEMLSWENVETSVAFAIVDGVRVEGCVRSTNAALAVPSLCKELGGSYGGGGGKLGKGAYYFNLGSLSLDNDSEDSSRDKLWECLNDRELKRVFKIIKK
jgi:nanoRNase/pAp phosphatase (c-di-AMP/oligoRNAs hydrolase)